MKPQALKSQPPAAPEPQGHLPAPLQAPHCWGHLPRCSISTPLLPSAMGPADLNPGHRCPTGPPASGGKPLFCTSSEGTCELPLGNLGGVEGESASGTALPNLCLGRQKHSPDMDIAVVPALSLWHWESHFSRYGGDRQFCTPGFSNGDGCKEQRWSRSREPSRPLSQPRALNQGPAGSRLATSPAATPSDGCLGSWEAQSWHSMGISTECQGRSGGQHTGSKSRWAAG